MSKQRIKLVIELVGLGVAIAGCIAGWLALVPESVRWPFQPRSPETTQSSVVTQESIQPPLATVTQFISATQDSIRYIDLGVDNGDFEQGFTSWWKWENDTLTNGRSGQGAQIIGDNPDVVEESLSFIAQYMTREFEAGKLYRASVWCKADIGSMCEIFFGDAVDYSVQTKYRIPGNGEWQQLVTDPITPAHNMRFSIFIYSNGAGTTAVYDDVKVEQVIVTSSQLTPDTGLAETTLIINGNSYSLPSDDEVRCLGGDKASRQTGYDVSVTYSLVIPEGWFIVWDSYKANWSPNDGSYEDDGLLSIYGPWEGTVTIVTGEYCAVPAEWAEFAWNDRKNAIPGRSLTDCVIRDGASTCR